MKKLFSGASVRTTVPGPTTPTRWIRTGMVPGIRATFRTATWTEYPTIGTTVHLGSTPTRGTVTAMDTETYAI